MIRKLMNALGWWEWWVVGEGRDHFAVTMSTNEHWARGFLSGQIERGCLSKRTEIRKRWLPLRP